MLYWSWSPRFLIPYGLAVSMVGIELFKAHLDVALFALVESPLFKVYLAVAPLASAYLK
jgi:hypothetical protein